MIHTRTNMIRTSTTTIHTSTNTIHTNTNTKVSNRREDSFLACYAAGLALCILSNTSSIPISKQIQIQIQKAGF